MRFYELIAPPSEPHIRPSAPRSNTIRDSPRAEAILERDAELAEAIVRAVLESHGKPAK